MGTEPHEHLGSSFLFAAVFLVALLYSSVGHGGASGYLAVLSFFSFSPGEMSTTALVLNVLVSGISALAFLRAGFFSWRLTWPFVAGSIPCAALGGFVKVSASTYWTALAAVLVFVACRLLVRPSLEMEDDRSKVGVQPLVAIASGGAIGFLSGIIGIGGGVFLTPLLVLMRWSSTKMASAVSAVFIVVNSLAGLAGRLSAGRLEFGSLGWLVLPGLLGGLAGSYLGANLLPSLVLRRLLAAVLFVAAAKLVLPVIKSCFG